MSITANRTTNPMKVITGPDTRWSYANVWEPKSINGGTPKYSVSLIIPKSDTVTVAKIKAAIEAAYQEGQSKLKGNSKLAKIARTSNPQIFAESVFPKTFEEVAQDSYVEQTEAYTSLFENQSKYRAIMAALAEILYREFNS